MAKARVRLILWADGAYACSASSDRDRSAMVQFDGKHTLRSTSLIDGRGEETVSTRSATAYGATVRTSRLVAHADDGLEWTWSVDAPHLERVERWTSPARDWEQHDRFPTFEARYRREGRGRYRGIISDASGKTLWESSWERRRGGGWRGDYRTPKGKPAGHIDFPVGAGGTGAPSSQGRAINPASLL